MKYLLSTLLIGLFVLPGAVAAETVVRTGETVSINSEQTIEDDFYTAGALVLVSGLVMGDMYSVGGSVTINGPIGADLTVVGGTTQVHSSVTDDVRVVGGEVTLADDVGGDVFVIGGVLNILDSANVAGDVFFFGGEALLEGSIAGSVHGAADSFRINGNVGGDVSVSAVNAVALGDRASIGGSIMYRAPAAIERSPQAVVVGEIIHNTDIEIGRTALLRLGLIALIIWLFAGLTLYLIFREPLEHLTARALTRPALTVGVGLGGIVLVPVVIQLLFAFVLSMLLGILGALFYLLLLVGSLVLVGVMTGALLARYLGRKASLSAWWVLGGSSMIILVSIIPIVGQISLLAVWCFTMGALVKELYRHYTVD